MKALIESQGWTHTKGDVCNCSGSLIQYWRNPAFPEARLDIYTGWWFVIKKQRRTVKTLSSGAELEKSLKALQLWKK